MKNNIKTGLALISALVLAFLAGGCTADKAIPTESPQGVPLRIAVSVDEVMTRLAELPGPGAMTEDRFGLQNVGLYIYYSSDYEQGKLDAPYVRNLECTIENNMLVPLNPTGLDGDLIYIYDKMTLVAFYPYNPDVEDFVVKADEEKYPITREDYSQQHYIPYRAQAETNPTIAYYVEMTFFPKHTYKVEIVLVADDPSMFPTGDVEVLPALDPLDNPDYPGDGKREKWYDYPESMGHDGTGSYVRRYNAYLWTVEGNLNNFKMGDILLRSDELTLIASRDLDVREQNVYRYGYNMSTGEIFIPSSTGLVYDRTSLAAISGGEGFFYQVCDIDLSTAPWDPIYKVGGRFDGGGHKLIGPEITSSGPNVGLFSSIKGNTTICNVNVIDPVINVTSNEQVYVGALCGRVNDLLTDAEKRDLIANLPPDLSDVVKQAILADLLANLVGETSDVTACRVENPTITVNAPDPVVGSVIGTAGNESEDGQFKAVIWDCYALGGKLMVNAASPDANGNAFVGGFCGLNNGKVMWCYTTTADITAQGQRPVPGSDPVEYELYDVFTGFTTMGTLFPDSGVTDSYSVLPDTTGGVTVFGSPGWGTYTANWPIKIYGWLDSPSTSFWYDMGAPPASYPILQYERR